MHSAATFRDVHGSVWFWGTETWCGYKLNLVYLSRVLFDRSDHIKISARANADYIYVLEFGSQVFCPVIFQVRSTTLRIGSNYPQIFYDICDFICMLGSGIQIQIWYKVKLLTACKQLTPCFHVRVCTRMNPLEVRSVLRESRWYPMCLWISSHL